jgi:hypothetical protein
MEWRASWVEVAGKCHKFNLSENGSLSARPRGASKNASAFADALDYLTGEKLLTFAEVAERSTEFCR